MAIANNHTWPREGTRWADSALPFIILVLLKSFKALLKIALNIRLETEDLHPVQVTSGTIHRERQTKLVWFLPYQVCETQCHYILFLKDQM